MPLTYRDLLERLKQVDEVSLLEILDIDSGTLVDRFDDRIEENLEYLISEFEDEQDSDESPE